MKQTARRFLYVLVILSMLFNLVPPTPGVAMPVTNAVPKIAPPNPKTQIETLTGQDPQSLAIQQALSGIPVPENWDAFQGATQPAVGGLGASLPQKVLPQNKLTNQVSGPKLPILPGVSSPIRSLPAQEVNPSFLNEAAFTIEGMLNAKTRLSESKNTADVSPQTTTAKTVSPRDPQQPNASGNGNTIYVPLLLTSSSGAKTIPADLGGIAASPDQELTVSFRPNGLPKDIAVTVFESPETALPNNFILQSSKMMIQADWVDSWINDGAVTVLDPEAWSVLQPGNGKPRPPQSRYWATVSIRFDTLQIGKKPLSIARLAAGGLKWEILPTHLDLQNKVATAETDRLGTFALVDNATFWQINPKSLSDIIPNSPDTIVVDELSSGFTRYEYDGSNDYWWNTGCGSSGCWNNHAWWTWNHSDFESTPPDIAWNWADWTPALSQSGYYYVEAFIPSADATTTAARYQIYHNGQRDDVVVNQAVVSGKWRPLNAFYFAAEGGEYVRLDDVVPEKEQKGSRIGFDAVRFIYAGQEPPKPVDTEPPVIHNVDRFMSNGLSNFRAFVTDNVAVAEVVLVFNGQSVTMKLVSAGIYEATVPVPLAQISNWQVVAVDPTGNVASFPPGKRMDIRGYLSRNLGSSNQMCQTGTCNPGSQSSVGDPVNTDPSSGNFSSSLVDLTIKGVGDSNIVIERSYNPMPNEPQGVIRYTQNGDAVVAQPFQVHPEFFGLNWSFLPSLLVMDNQLLNGAQVRYPDGHTADFKQSGGGFVAVETRVYDILRKDGDRYVLTTQDLKQYYFNLDGRLIRTADKNNNFVDYTYSGTQLVRIENSAGRGVTFTYTSDGLVSDISAPENIHLHYEYSDGRLIAFTNAEGGIWKYTYDSEGRLTAITTPENHPSLRLRYDDVGRVVEQTEGASARHTIAYNLAERTTTITDANNQQVTHVYDEKYRTIESRNAAGSEYYKYNERDERIYFKDRNGQEWTYTYNDRGRRLTEDGPLTAHREWAYNSLNLPVHFAEKIDATRSREMTFTYDAKGNLTNLCNSYNCSQIIYDGRGLPTDVTDFAGHLTHNGYDAGGDLVASTIGANETTRFGHDGLGRLTERWTPLNDHYTYTYDKNSRLTAVNGPLGYHLGYSYDPNGNLETATDPNDGVTRYAHDLSENILTVTSPMQYAVETYTYGPMNELKTFTDAEGRIWTYAYDNTLRLTDIYGPLETHVGMSYDAVGNVTNVTDSLNRVTHTEYDALYRPTTVTRNYQPGQPLSADTNVTTAYEYNLAGDVLKTTDPEGNDTVYKYDLLSRMIWQKDAAEQESSYQYDGMGNLIVFTNPRGFPTAYEYDAANRLFKITDAASNVTTFVYTLDGTLQDKTDPLGVVTRYEYNELDRPVAEIRNYRPGQPGDWHTNVTTAYEYDRAGNLRFITDPRGFRSEMRYDAAMRLVDSFDFAGGHTQFTYDKVDNLLSLTDANTHTTHYVYDALDHRTAVTNAEGHSVTLTYNKLGQVTDLKDANGNLTHYDLDALGRVVLMLDALQGRWEYQYNRVGSLLTEIDANGHPTTYTYDKVYRPLTVTDAEGHVTAFQWDKNSNLSERTDGNQHSTLYTYDKMDRLETLTNPENETTGYQYDALGNPTHLIEADGTVTLYGYDELYRLITVTENYVANGPANNDTNVASHYVYDASGNLHVFTNANGNATTFEHDGMGRLTQEVDALSNTWVYTYDGVGNLHTRLDANHKLTTYSYYDDDQLRQVDYQNGQSVAYTYDRNNNRLTMVDSLGTTTWVLDELNRVKSVSDPFNRVLNYQYDPVGNRTAIQYPDGLQVTYTYLDNNWLETMTDPEGNVTSYTRDGIGNILVVDYPNDILTTITYDKADRVLTLINQQMVGAKKTNSAFDYTYNEVGHVTQVVNTYGWRNPPVVTETYTYDGLHRLAGMSDSEDVVMSYTYDKVGNRIGWTSNDDLTTQTPRDGFVATYTFNAINQLTLAVVVAEHKVNDQNIHYTYDANGNRTNQQWEGPQGTPLQGTDYSYDPENRLTSALDYQHLGGKRVDRALTTLAYDGGGRRLVQTYDPKTGASGEKRVEYTFDGLDPVAEYSLLNGQRDNYYRGADGRITTMQHFPSGTQGQMYWYSYNFKGDVVGLSKQSGQSTHNYRYDPYGGVLPDTGNFTDPHNHYTLTGKEYDENTGLVYFGARFYDPKAAQWVTQDSYRGKSSEPVSLQRYLYVNDNPINYVDQYGFSASDGCGVVRSCVSSTSGYGAPASYASNSYTTSSAQNNSATSCQSAEAQVRTCLGNPTCPKLPWDKLDQTTRDILIKDGWDPITYDAEYVTGNAINVSGTLHDPMVWVAGAIVLVGTAIAIVPEVVAAFSITGGEVATAVCLNDGDCTNEIKIGAKIVEVSDHAIGRMSDWSISLEQVQQTVSQSEEPFQYFQNGSWLTGYYNSATKIFVGVGNKVTTVIGDVKWQYIQNLKNRVP